MPVLDEADVIDGQLRRLAAQTYDGPWELLVADNGSTDGTAERAEGWADRLPVRVVDCSARRGCGAAKNQGLEHTRAERILFCDADDEVSDRWLAAHVEALEDHELTAGPIRFFGSTSHEVVAATAPPVALGWMPFAFGCNFGAHRELLDRMDGFDEGVTFAEDIDFCWRAGLAGVEIGFAPDALVEKRQSSTLRARFRQHRNYGRSDVQLRRTYAPLGLPPADLSIELRRLGWVVLHAPTLSLPSSRPTWATVAGHQFGTIQELLLGRRRSEHPAGDA